VTGPVLLFDHLLHLPGFVSKTPADVGMIDRGKSCSRTQHQPVTPILLTLSNISDLISTSEFCEGPVPDVYIDACAGLEMLFLSSRKPAPPRTAAA